MPWTGRFVQPPAWLLTFDLTFDPSNPVQPDLPMGTVQSRVSQWPPD